MLYYEKTGRGPTVVLLHGLPFDHTLWELVVNALSNQFTFIVPDLPGAGKSEDCFEGETLSDFAKEVNEILIKEHQEKVMMAGHSMGGYTTMAFLKRFPQKLNSVSLVHSSPLADSKEKIHIREKSIRLIDKGEKAKNAFVKGMIKSLFSERHAKNCPERLRCAIENGLQLKAKSLISYYHALISRDDTSNLLPNLQIPIQFILGTEDHAVDFSENLPLTIKAPVSDVCLYAHCGHVSMAEEPTRLVDDLKRFWIHVSGSL